MNYCPYVYSRFGMEYAGFWRRLVAFVIDLVILAFGSFALALLLVPLLLAFPEQSTAFLGSGFAQPAAVLVALLLGWAYFAGFECSASHATMGKLVLEIAVTDLQGEGIGFGRASLRYLAKLVSILSLGLGFLLMLWGERRQALHDRIAGTAVVVKPLFSPR